MLPCTISVAFCFPPSAGIPKCKAIDLIGLKHTDGVVRPEKLPEADLSIYPFQDFSFSQENISRVYTYAQILPAIYIVGINIANLSALLMCGGGGYHSFNGHGQIVGKYADYRVE